jgi:hypothetical protein
MPMLFLLTLLTGEPHRITEEILEWSAWAGEHRDLVLPGAVQVIGAGWWAAEGEDSSYLSSTFPFEELAPRFGRIVQQWLELMDRARGPLVSFFTGWLEQGQPTLEDRFVNVTRSAEAWHRQIFDGKLLSEEEWKAVTAQAADAAGDHADLIRMRLQHGNEWTLKMRLDDMVKRCGGPLADLITRYGKFTRAVVDTRNFLTHGERKGIVYDTDEMFWAERTLSLLMQVSLLQVLEVTDDLDAAVQRPRLWRSWITSPNNVLLNT